METANALACLDGFPASGRRVAQQLKSSLAEVGHPEVFGQVLKLMGAETFENEITTQWIDAWVEDFESASELSAHPELGEARKNYYLGGFQSTLEDSSTVDILWPMLSTWDRAVHVLQTAEKESNYWADVKRTLRLSEEHTEQRESELEDLMDHSEEVLENWAETAGA